MADFRWDTFKGIRPRVRPRLLPPNEATVAENVRLGSGAIEPWNGLLTDEAATSSGVVSLYRMSNGGNPIWLQSENELDHAPGPVPDDVLERTYYTGEAEPRMTYTTIANTAPPYPADYRKLGTPAPTAAPVATPDATAEIPDVVVGGTVDPGGFGTNFVLADVAIQQGLPKDELAPAGTFGLDTGWYLGLTEGTLASDNGYEPAGTQRAFRFDFPIGKTLRVTEVVDVNNIKVEDANNANFIAQGDDRTLGAQTWFRDGDGVNVVSAAFIRFYLPNETELTITGHGLAVNDVIRVTAVPEYVAFEVTQPSGTWTVDSPVLYGSEMHDTGVTRHGPNDPSPAAVNTWPNTAPAQGVDEFWTGTGRGWPAVNMYFDKTGPAGPNYPIAGSFVYELVQRETEEGIENYIDIITDIESRIYVYTYVSELGEEGPPSDPTASVTISTDGQIDISGFTAPPTDQRNITDIRIYRANTGSVTTDFQFVDEIAYNDPTYEDTKLDTELGEVLQTVSWEPPPAGLTGIVAGANGILAGFVGKTVWFSEPYYPHAWPPEYKIAVEHDVVGIGVLPNGFAILTKGTPYQVSGDHPRGMSLQRFEFQQACVSKKSIVSTLDSVMYASPDGLCEIGGRGFAIVTNYWANKREWQDFNPSTLQGYWHDSKYFGFHSEGGFVFGHNDDSIGWTTTTDILQAGFLDPEEDTLYGIFQEAVPIAVMVSNDAVSETQRIATSLDGITWSPVTPGDSSASEFSEVVFDSVNNAFVVCGEVEFADRTTSAAIMSSPDGTTWTRGESVTPDWGVWDDAAFSPALGMVLVVGTSVADTNADARYTTDGGTTWNSHPNISNDYKAVAWSPARAEFLAFNLTNVYNSTTGTSFNDLGAGDFPPLSSTGKGVLEWMGGTVLKYLAADDSGRIWYSSTGAPASWTMVPTITGVRDIGVNVDGDLAVAIGGSGAAYTSTNGVDWITQTTGSSATLNGVDWMDGFSLWIAVGAYAAGSILTSPDGVTWTSRTAAVNIDYTSVAQGTINSASNISSWDGDVATKRAFTWKSGEQKATRPINLGAGRIVAASYPVTLNIWNDEGDLVVTDREVLNDEVFRLPGGYLTDTFYLQVEGDDAIDVVHVAENVQELLDG